MVRIRGVFVGDDGICSPLGAEGALQHLSAPSVGLSMRARITDNKSATAHSLGRDRRERESWCALGFLYPFGCHYLDIRDAHSSFVEGAVIQNAVRFTLKEFCCVLGTSAECFNPRTDGGGGYPSPP